MIEKAYKVEVLFPLRDAGWIARTPEQQHLGVEFRRKFIENLEAFIVSYLAVSPAVNELRIEWFENTGQADVESLKKLNATKLVEDLNIAPHCEIIKIITTLEVNEKYFFENNSHSDPDDLKEDVAYVALYSIQEAIDTALFLSELCYPGSVSSLSTYVYSEGCRSVLKGKSALYSLNCPGDEKLEWPELQDIDLINAYKWATKVGYKNEYFAKSRISRSLAAFSHLLTLTENRNGEQLFRAMQGLEAFYCDGNSDLRKQLYEKSVLWVGEWSSVYSCGKLYEIRSKFVHGSSLVSYKGVDVISEEEVKSHNEENNGCTLATRLLVATLQRCISEGVTDIAWKYGYETVS